MEIKLAIFDFSGTLAFSNQDEQSFLREWDNLGFGRNNPLNPASFYRSFWNLLSSAKSWKEIAKKLAPKEGKTEDKAIQRLEMLLKECFGFKLYDDARFAFDLPIQKAILTAGSRFLLEPCNIPKNIEIFTPFETSFLKPDPKAFLFVLKQLKISPKEAAMIGDETERDLIPALNLGMRAFLIEREDKNIGILPNKIIKLSSLKELENYLL